MAIAGLVLSTVKPALQLWDWEPVPTGNPASSWNGTSAILNEYAAPPKIHPAKTAPRRRPFWRCVGARHCGATRCFFFNPAAPFLSRLPVSRADRLNCPGCGGTRSLYALLHGDFPPR